MQETVNKCTAALPRAFKRDRGKQDTQAEQEPNLIEITPLQARCSAAKN